MHLFLLAWRCKQSITEHAKQTVAEMQRLHHHLCPQTLWHRQTNQGLFATSIHLAPELAAKRRYRYESDHRFILYDGCAVNTQQTFSAHRADHIADNWETLHQHVEGQFVYIKGDTDTDSLEIMTDPLGLYQVYITQSESGYLISNSVYILEKLIGGGCLDELGSSLYLSMGWAGSNRTLIKNIHVLPPGSIIKLHKNTSAPQSTSYFSRQQYRDDTHQPNVRDTAKQLAQIVKLTSEIDQQEGPLTAGKDSRLILAMLRNQDVPAKYFSLGQPGTLDVDIATEIAKHFGLEHRLINNAETSETEWNDAIHRLILQTDGMGTLAHVENGLNHPDILHEFKIHYYGAGGEIARSFWFKNRENLFIFPYKKIDTYTHSLKLALSRNRTHLLTEDTLNVFNKYIQDYAHGIADDGFHAVDLEQIFYLEERVRRWAGINFRQVNDYLDVFSPFCTRPFVKSAFTLDKMQRYAESLHYQLIAELEPELLNLPMDPPWHTQDTRQLYRYVLMKLADKRLRAIIRKAIKIVRNARKGAPTSHSNHDVLDKRSAWLEKRLATFRSFCLDQTQSEIWRYINKQRFEQLTHPSTQASERTTNQASLYDTLSLFYYEKHRLDIKNRPNLLAHISHRDG